MLCIITQGPLRPTLENYIDRTKGKIMAHEVQEFDMTAHRELKPWWYSDSPDQANIFTGKVTTDEMLKHTGLDWPVILRRLQALPEEGDNWEVAPMESHRGTFRGDMNPPLPLGTVSDKYTPLQNRDIFEAFNPMIEDGLLEYETGGSLRNCRSVWVLARYMGGGSHTVDIMGDAVRQYMLITTNHDGTGSVEIKPTNVRVVCNNTLQAALKQGVSMKFSHVGDVSGRVGLVANAVGQAGEHMETLQKIFRTMTSIQLNEEERYEFFSRVAPDVFQADKHEKAQLTVLRTRKEWEANLEAEENLLVNNYRKDSLWASYQAITRSTSHRVSNRVKDTAAWHIDGGAAKINRLALAEATRWINEVLPEDETVKELLAAV